MISNVYYFYKTISFYDEYSKELKEGNSNILRDQQEIKRVLQKADIKESRITNAQPIGFGKIEIVTASSFDNMCYKGIDEVNAMTSAFEMAIGVYRQRIVDSFNPIYWIEFIIFIPKHIIQYLGLDTENISTRLFQLFYWILGAIYAIYSNQINQIIQDFLSNFFK